MDGPSAGRQLGWRRSPRTTLAGSTRSWRLSPQKPTRIRTKECARGRSLWSCGGPASTSTRRGWPSRRDSRTCRRSRLKAARRSWSALPRFRRARHQRRLDPKRKKLGGIAPDADDPRSGMRPDDRPQRLDHQRVGDRLQVSRHPLCVGLRIRMADDETHALAGVDLSRQLDNAIERSVKSAHPLERRHEPIADAQHRLYLQHRTEEGAGATGAATPPPELERRPRKVGWHVRPHRQDATLDTRRIEFLRCEGGRHQRDEAERHRHHFRVDHVHTLGVGHVCRLPRRRVGPAQLLRDVDRHHRVVVVEQRRVCFGESAGRRLRCRRMRRRGWELAIELLRRDVDAVEQRLAVEMKRQRNHGYRTGGREHGWQVGGGVGNDRDGALAQLKWSSSMCVPSWRWKKRRSSGLIATRVTSTSAVVKIPILKSPKPITIPIAATTQMVAAVVRPLTSVPCRRMAPAPRKPTPVTIWAAIRVGSVRLPKYGSRLIVVNRHAPTPTSAMVRIPAG